MRFRRRRAAVHANTASILLLLLLLLLLYNAPRGCIYVYGLRTYIYIYVNVCVWRECPECILLYYATYAEQRHI
jgi:hypothetical protein